VRFTSPSEHCDFRPAPGHREPTRPCGRTDPRRRRLPWGLRPLRDVSRRRPHTPGIPTPDFGPSSAFRTPSTVYATTGLAGLFHPAAAYRVRPSGGCPPPGARPAFTDRHALVPLCSAPPVLTPGRTRRPRLQGLAPQTDAVVAGNGEEAGTPRPSWTLASSGLSPRAPCDPAPTFPPGETASTCDLWRDELTATGPWRVAGARIGWRRITLPARARFGA
jgi:hypothetical protein